VQEASVSTAEPFDLAAPPGPRPEAELAPAGSERTTALVREHFAFVWRVLRRLGLSEADADDATQQVFLVAARRCGDIASGSERAFLFGTAMNVAARAQRSERRRREEPDSELEQRRDSRPGPEELVDRRRARELLDQVLSEMALELRVVFVLYEVEELTMIEIARLLEVPQGTVASRLRRAREDFNARVSSLEARVRSTGVRP
jgi:RNA polymerase sigma-70 factor, ECF subfamily